MLLKTRGIAQNVNESLIGRVTRNDKNLDSNTFLLTEQPFENLPNGDYIGVLTTQKTNNFLSEKAFVYNIPSLDHLSEGDLIAVGTTGNINTLYRINSHYNTLLTTERCNSNCLMCSQPPRDRDDIDHYYNILKKLIPLIPKDCPEINLSGGEPTLMGELFFNMIEQIQHDLPDTEIHVLTNGRTFAWNSMAERLGEINCNRLMLGIPLYADYYQIHDYIVQANNAFYQTVAGLHNLARYNQRIEIRVVLHKQSIPRLVKLAKYIYKNLPFVEHITFMGLEYIGYTPFNIDKLWIDPYDYNDELEESVEFLAGQGMNVSIYNSQLCVLPESLWKYSRKSISDWKNSYLPECEQCSKLIDCGGLFTWNLKKHSNYIKAFSNID